MFVTIHYHQHRIVIVVFKIAWITIIPKFLKLLKK